MSTPAGWYPDPSDPARLRWWDGSQWTVHHSAGQYRSAPKVVAYDMPKRDVDTNTVWIWLAIAVTIVPMFGLLLLDADTFVATTMSSSNGDGGYGDIAGIWQWQLRSLFVSLLGWVALAAYVVLSWLDWRELRRRGVVLPFHWAWSFLGMLVYVIGRTVVLRRRTVAGGWPPLWGIIASSALSLVVASVWLIGFFRAMFDAIAMMSSYGG